MSPEPKPRLTFFQIPLFKGSFSLIKKDFFILVPYLILFLITGIVTVLYPDLFTTLLENKVNFFLVFGFFLALEQFFKGMSIYGAHTLYQNNRLDVRDMVAAGSRYVTPLVIGYVPILILFYFGITAMGTESSIQSSMNAFYKFGLFFGMMLFYLVSYFFPIIMVVNDFSLLKTFSESFRFIFKSFNKVLILLGVLFLCFFMTLMVSAGFETIPGIGAVISLLVTGVGYGFIQVMGLIFYKVMSGASLPIDPPSESL